MTRQIQKERKEKNTLFSILNDRRFFFSFLENVTTNLSIAFLRHTLLRTLWSKTENFCFQLHSTLSEIVYRSHCVCFCSLLPLQLNIESRRKQMGIELSTNRFLFFVSFHLTSLVYFYVTCFFFFSVFQSIRFCLIVAIAAFTFQQIDKCKRTQQTRIAKRSEQKIFRNFVAL